MEGACSLIVALQGSLPLRAWHLRLAERLEAAGHTVGFLPSRRAPAADWRTRLVLAAERRIYGSRSQLFAPVAESPAILGAREPQVRVVLAEGGRAGCTDLVPLFDGGLGETALLRALIQGRAPVVTVCAGEVVLAAGHPAIEDPSIVSRALDSVLSRVVTLVVAAVAALAGGGAPVVVPEGSPEASRSAAACLVDGFFRKLTRRLGAAKGRPDHWQIAYRLGQGCSAAETRAWPPDSFRRLADDGRRFYADPFPFEEQGLRYIFFEDFPYATRKGVIGMVAIESDGTASRPKTVLEAPVHLSYPTLLRNGTSIYMLPEMSGAARIQLFRADPFPDRWVADQILVDGVMASDATLIMHDGRLWLFATVSESHESTWDQLCLFHAPTLSGPWTAHPLNPVLIDAGTARPAGAMWHEGSQLMRVAQDCRAGYGTGLALCRVDRLDPDGFVQTVVRRLGPPGGFGAVGVHTLNRCGDLEVIDLRVPHRRRG